MSFQNSRLHHQHHGWKQSFYDCSNIIWQETRWKQSLYDCSNRSWQETNWYAPHARQANEMTSYEMLCHIHLISLPFESARKRGENCAMQTGVVISCGCRPEVSLETSTDPERAGGWGWGWGACSRPCHWPQASTQKRSLCLLQPVSFRLGGMPIRALE